MTPSHPVRRQTINDYHTLKKTYKKFELIASHTCRRSFCTNEYLKGTPTLFIMKISGPRTEKNFLKYIKVDEQVATEKILEF